ncbi:MAG: phosphate/phosphite/phosphonate ABC transporter substrate-binding protein, partial [Betaproteobacteria bacterium]
MTSTRFLHALAIVFAAATLGTPLFAPALAADACTNRGELDAMFCDTNKDMVADVPTDTKKWKNPSTIVFTYT